jgi:hypothetical protein
LIWVVPSFLTTNPVAVVDPIANAGAVPFEMVGLIDSCAQGVDDPIPRNPALVNVDVAVPPKYAVYADSCVDEACPLNNISDVVADCPATGCVKISFVAVINPASLLNHDSLIDDDAIALTAPFDPVNRKPCPVPMFKLVVLAVWNDE